MVFRPFTLALIQLGNVGPNKTANLAHARAMILKATRTKKPDIVVLPEWFNTPSGNANIPNFAEKFGFVSGQRYDVARSESESARMLSGVAREAQTWLIGGTYVRVRNASKLCHLGGFGASSIPERDDDGKVYNTCTVYNPAGDLVAMHRKVHLYDVHIPGKIKCWESEMLTAGDTTNYFDTEFARIGLGICYDVRFPELSMIAARQGCHILIYPGSFNTTTGPFHWELLQRARAVDNQVFMSMCSRARDLTSAYHAWAHSMIVDPMGRVLAEAGEGEETVYAEIDPQVLTDVRAGIPVTTQRRFDVYTDVAAERTA